MKTILTLILAICYLQLAHAQTPTDLYNQKNYPELIKLESKSAKLSSDELYMVGFAFFQSENDSKAIEFYDKAIAKGLDNGSVHFYKGMSLRYLKKYDEALKEIDISLQREPTNQEFMNEQGLTYRSMGDMDKALDVFEQAQKLPNTYAEPYYWAATIYYDRKDFTKALDRFYKASGLLPNTNNLLVETWKTIGLLEYVQNKDYIRSYNAYIKAIQLTPTDYKLYSKLMKSYNAAKEFDKADSVFAILKAAYDQGKLPEDEMKFKKIAIDQFSWHGQIATISRSFVEPKEELDILYKIFVANKEDTKIERRFVVEKTFQLPGDDLKYILCEEAGDSHITYPIGWSTDTIRPDALQKAVIDVLNGKTKYGAKSK